MQLLEYPSGNFTGDFILSWSSSANSEFFYNLLYSYDGGSPGTWLGLSHSKDIRESEALKYSINSESMRGSLSSTKIRIIATDGINYAIDTSDSFYVSMKPPTIQLFLPTGDQPYYTQGNRYSGYQWDVRVEGIDGEHIPEDSYVWRSDVDGVVGRGDVYYGDNLSLGRHKLSFEVTALDGQLYTKDNIAEIIVVNSKPEIIVRVGDDTTVDLACNELELSVNFSNVPVKEVRYSFNARRGDASKIIDRIEQLPIRYHMEDDTRVRITASNFAKLYSRYDNVVKFRDCDP